MIVWVSVVMKRTVVGDSNNSSFKNYTHPDDHTIRTTDTPGFKPFTLKLLEFKEMNALEGWAFEWKISR